MSVSKVLAGASLLGVAHPAVPVIIGEHFCINGFHSVNNAVEVRGVDHVGCSCQNPCHLGNSYPTKESRAGVDNCPVFVIGSKDAVVCTKVGKEVHVDLAWKEGASVRIALNLIFLRFVKEILCVLDADLGCILSVSILSSDALACLELN